jgi:hypothetical protein
MRPAPLLLALGLAAAALAGGSGEETAPPAGAPPGGAKAAPAPEPRQGLMLALSVFEVTPEGKALPKPGPARLEILRPQGGGFELIAIDDPESNVFHKAMVYTPPGGTPGILTLGGTAALLKLRRPDGASEVLWQKDFGGRFSRMRDVEVGDVYGDGKPTIAVATHDQGVVATVRPGDGGGFEVNELDHEKDTFVHEIEIGDLDRDGALEIYATPSEPNRLDGTPQPGAVTRYEPGRGEGRSVAADLGNRHAKEILVKDVDGDGTDELYVSVEGETEGEKGATRLVNPVEIRRFDAGTDPKGGAVIARLEGERLCRFLTAGDVDGDGKLEMVAAGFKTGLWLLRPGADARAAWKATSIDRESGGFEHASLLADLDEDGRAELYVASDDHAEVRRYLWRDGRFARDVIYERKVNGRKVTGSAFTWNIMPVPLELIPKP